VFFVVLPFGFTPEFGRFSSARAAAFHLSMVIPPHIFMAGLVRMRLGTISVWVLAPPLFRCEGSVVKENSNHQCPYQERQD